MSSSVNRQVFIRFMNAQFKSIVWCLDRQPVHSSSKTLQVNCAVPRSATSLPSKMFQICTAWSSNPTPSALSTLFSIHGSSRKLQIYTSGQSNPRADFSTRNSIQFMTRIIIQSDDHAVTNSIWSCECEQKTNLIYVLEIVITLSELGHLAAACYFPFHQIFLLCFFWKLQFLLFCLLFMNETQSQSISKHSRHSKFQATPINFVFFFVLCQTSAV